MLEDLGPPVAAAHQEMRPAEVESCDGDRGHRGAGQLGRGHHKAGGDEVISIGTIGTQRPHAEEAVVGVPDHVVLLEQQIEHPGRVEHVRGEHEVQLARLLDVGAGDREDKHIQYFLMILVLRYNKDFLIKQFDLDVSGQCVGYEVRLRLQLAVSHVLVGIITE